MTKVCFSYIFGLHTQFPGPLQDGKEGPIPHLSLVFRQTRLELLRLAVMSG